MSANDLLALYTQDQRINVTYPDSQREVLPHLIRALPHSATGEGTIIYSDLTETNADRVIDEQIAWFTARGQSFEWKAYDMVKSPPAPAGSTTGAASVSPAYGAAQRWRTIGGRVSIPRCWPCAPRKPSADKWNISPLMPAP